MSAPSHTATFVYSGVACECNVPNTDVQPWVAWERTTPLVYSLTNDAIVPQSSSITQFPAASSPPSQQRTRRSSRETESTSDSHAPHRERNAARRVEIAHIPRRTSHEVKKERTSHSNSRSRPLYAVTATLLLLHLPRGHRTPRTQITPHTAIPLDLLEAHVTSARSIPSGDHAQSPDIS